MANCGYIGSGPLLTYSTYSTDQDTLGCIRMFGIGQINKDVISLSNHQLNDSNNQASTIKLCNLLTV